MTSHTDILNYLIKRYDLKSYLEIGVQRKLNYNAIDLPITSKVCVDPDPEAEADFIGTSDEYFEKIHGAEFDLILIDGLHHADQVQRDFENALRILSPKGYIAIHDTVPESEDRTHVPRDTKIWNGDVYKFACTLCKYDWIEFKTFPQDHGLTIVWKSKSKKYNSAIEEITWPYYLEQRENLLRYNNELPAWKP